jgi:hypothetical protein
LRKLQTGPQKATLPTGRDDVMWGAEGAGGDDGGTPPVRPAMRGMRVGSRAAARRVAGRRVARRRASIDFPASGRPRSRT